MRFAHRVGSRLFATALLLACGDGDRSAGSDADPAGIVAWCDRGDTCLRCDGAEQRDCAACGSAYFCTAEPGCTARRVDCPTDVTAPTRPDAGGPSMCPMTEASCATEGGPDQICVPGGTFTLGSDDHDAAAPAHEVYVSSFWLDRLEVTVARFRECLASGQCTGGDPAYLGDTANDPKPVVGLTVAEMIRFCNWADGRLPTEAELERAARGDDDRTYPWGEDADCSRANFAGCTAGELQPAGSYPSGASPYGILDLVGNAAETAVDAWREGGYDAYWPVTPVCDPIHTGNDGAVTIHVARGCGAGSIRDASVMATCTAFTRASGLYAESAPTAVLESPSIGFRCARDG